jgi:hypothetical protein
MSTKDMHVQEKQAWFMLVVMVAAFVLYGAAVAVTGFHRDAVAAFAVIGIGGFAGLIGRRAKGAEENVMDERDRAITRRSRFVSLRFFFVLFILGAVVSSKVLGGDFSIDLSTLLRILLPCWCAMWLVQSLTTIYLYRRGGNVDKDELSNDEEALS